uniref:Apple domain-containing protein n=1 Tax=Elaeophora elaphi TaxID=1147741 RepID=A0A0R3RQS7_9BILA
MTITTTITTTTTTTAAAVYYLLLAATTATTRSTTITTTIATTTATATAITTSTSNAKKITSVEGNDSITDSSPVTAAITTNTSTALIMQLPHKTLLQSLWWIDLRKLLEKDILTHRSVIEASDNSVMTTVSNPQTFISDISSESKIHFLDDIAHELRKNPNQYKVSVERTDGRQTWMVIRSGNYHKYENMVFTDILGIMHQFPAKRDSPEQSKANYHILRIKLPFEVPNNGTLNEREIQQEQTSTFSQNTSGIDAERLNFEKLPEKYVKNQHGYHYRIQIHDSQELPFTGNSTTDHEVRLAETGDRKAGKTENEDGSITKRKITLAISSPCFGMIDHQLLYNAAYKTLFDVSLEQCRCNCANTWIEKDCELKCKSFQYSNITRKCLLNEDDHKGNFDLVYSKDIDYFYKICPGEDIVKEAVRNCPMGETIKDEQIVLGGTSANLDRTINNDEESKTIRSTQKRSTIGHRSVFSPSAFRTQSVYWWEKSGGKEEGSNSGITEEVVLSPDLWSKILKRKSAASNLKSLVLELMKNQPEEINDEMKEYKYRLEIRHEDGSTTNTPYGNRGIRSTKDSDFETMEESFAARTISPDYTEMVTMKLLPHEKVKSVTKKPEVMKPTEYVGIEANNGDSEKFKKPINELNKSTTQLMDNNQQTSVNKDLGEFKKKMKISHFSYLLKKSKMDRTEGFDHTADDYNINSLNENDSTTIAVTVPEGSGEITETSDEYFEGANYSDKQ